MLNLIPYPYRYEEREGFFLPDRKPTLADWIGDARLPWLDTQIRKDFSVEGVAREAYRLEIRPEGVTLTAAEEGGALCAFVTLIQLAETYGGKLPSCVIEDKPLYGYRGFMLDVGRYFYTVEEVKRFADFCALHKINVLHWHLTEDQGWRIEIKKYPKLATVGSVRTHTNFNRKKHGGFYTQSQVREIVEYCRKLNIEVIPEIDMPGHMQAAIACYPELSCFDRKLPVATHFGVKHDILCAGKESTYRFVFDVLDEVAELFDSQYIHLGGDEAPKMRWELCPHCNAKKEKLGLTSMEDLQAYFMNRVAKYLQAKGKTAVMWNEIHPTGKCAPEICWQLWHYGTDEEKAKIVGDIADNGRKIVYSASASCYIDFPYKMLPLKTTYVTPPEIEGIPEQCLLGMETTLWTEYVPDMKKAMYMSVPRVGSLCELMWSPKGARSYPAFLQRLPYYFDFMKACGFVPSKRKKPVPGKFKATLELAWFKRRPLHWEGLHNLIDDARVKKLAAQISATPKQNDTADPESDAAKLSDTEK